MPPDRNNGVERRVAEFHKAEEGLRKNEEKFRNLFNLSNDAIFIHDPAGTIVDVNRKALELFEYTEAEFKTVTIQMLHPEDALEKSKWAFQNVMEHGVVRFEIDFKKKNGEVFPAEVSSSVFRSGGRKYVQGIVRDISRRKRSEKALRDSEAKLRAMLNASPVGIVLLDSSGKILDTNTEHAHRFKLTRSDMTGKCLWDLLPQSVLERRRHEIETVFETGEPFHGEDEREGVWNEYHIHPAIRSDSGDIQAVILEAMNITDRKQAEKALLESENRYRSLFHNTHSAMLIIDPESGKVLDANPAAISFYGWRRQEITDMKISDINVMTETQISREMQRANQELRRVFYFRHRLADGDIRDVEVYSGPITIQDRQLLFSIIHDVTERKKFEKERDNLIRELQTALKEIKTLRGILPICSGCKKIRDDQGYWNLLESYIHKHSEAKFSHGLCPDCARKYYPELYNKKAGLKKPGEN